VHEDSKGMKGISNKTSTIQSNATPFFQFHTTQNACIVNPKPSAVAIVARVQVTFKHGKNMIAEDSHG
jgi:hypothetical protein